MQTFKKFSDLKAHLDREQNERDVEAARKLRKIAPAQRANKERNGQRGPVVVKV